MNDQPTQVNSPYSWSFPDYAGRTLTVTVNFNNNTRAIQSMTVVREDLCLYRWLLWGLGPDGVPDNTAKKRQVPFGTSTITKAQLSTLGFEVFEDLLVGQFTVGF